MSFFTTSTGENAAANATGSFEMGGGDFAPIPKDTRVLAICEEAKISEHQGERYVNMKWDIAQPAQFKGRKIFQKIKCWETDTTKRDKAIRMLAAIDANAGGKLAASGQEPTDMLLQTSLTAKPMVLKLGVWELEDKSKSGNWVQSVSKHNPAGGVAASVPVKAQPVMPTLYDDDIEF